MKLKQAVEKTLHSRQTFLKFTNVWSVHKRKALFHITPFQNLLQSDFDLSVRNHHYTTTLTTTTTITPESNFSLEKRFSD